MPAPKESLFPTSRRPHVLILGNKAKDAVGPLAVATKTFLLDKHVKVTIDLEPTYDPILSKPDLVIVIGGDGSILAASHRLRRRRVPVLGVNVGRVGFLSAVSPERLEVVLDDLFANRYRIENRAMMAFSVVRDNEVVLESHVLNEIVLARHPSDTMMSIELVDERRSVCSYYGDGLIVSTATGSTAYNLSAGGPILAPSLEACVVQPLAPHTLAMRPLVLPSNRNFSLRVMSAGTLTSDGHLEGDVLPGDKVRIGASRRKLKLVVDPNNRFYARLRSKLHWGESAGSGED
ncbi:MAG: NAD(+)/NADH kinase [Planctomycetota bacterium]|nr:NAD(+)/NADH kinase [Planctomycetota bacterium]